MKNYYIRYLAGLLFIAIGIYDWIRMKYLPETLLYVFLGAAFLLMGFIAHYPDHPQKKVLNSLSWVLIIGAALSFIYVLTIPGGKTG
jgi:putative Ca2+/H+ antiporter (TMEM165/GDT1 family)